MKPLALVTLLISAAAARAQAPHIESMDAVLAHYLAIRRDLAADKAAKLAAHVRALTEALEKAAAVARPWQDEKSEILRGQIGEARRVLREGKDDLESGDIERVRKHFFALSKPLIRYVGHFRAAEGRYRTFWCSMKKAAWIQVEPGPGNPYYGVKMHDCGERVRTRGEPDVPATQPSEHKH